MACDQRRSSQLWTIDQSAHADRTAVLFENHKAKAKAIFGMAGGRAFQDVCAGIFQVVNFSVTNILNERRVV